MTQILRKKRTKTAKVKAKAVMIDYDIFSIKIPFSFPKLIE